LMKKYVEILIFLLFLIGNIQSFADDSTAQYLPFSKKTALFQKELFESSMPSKLIQTLDIQSGDIILDLKADSGQYALAFAKHLGETGAVYAADSREAAINFIKAQSEENGLRNIVPVVVTDNGFDPFYATRRFDLVFAGNVYYSINDRPAFFQTLGNSIEQDGRIVFLTYKYEVPLKPDDVTDWSGLVSAILELKEDDPFYPFFYDVIARMGRLRDINQLPEWIKPEIIIKFNEIFADPCFFKQFFNGSELDQNLSVEPSERKILQYFMKVLMSDNTDIVKNCSSLKSLLDPMSFSSKKSKDLPDSSFIRAGDRARESLSFAETRFRMAVFFIKTINMTLIVQKFRDFLFNRTPPYFPGGSDPSLSLKGVQTEMAQAGFVLESAHDFIPYQILTIFKKADASTLPSPNTESETDNINNIQD
ncbi:MAG: class I SAM-dependent methyltransferase, partial [Candidatus Omnitrophota bacterium]